jgi:hypothetical protein
VIHKTECSEHFSAEIDEIIANDIFKTEDEEGRKNAMLGLIELK